MINKEFFLALDDLAKERKLNRSMLVESIEAGLASAYKKEMGESRTVSAKLNPEAGKIEFFAYQTVVEGEPEDEGQLSLDEARELKEDAQIGDIIGEDITPKELSRIAAQTAKQVIMQRINEAIREQISAEMSDKEDELVTAIVRRKENNVVYVEIANSQMEGVMSLNDQVYGENYEIGERLKVYVKRVRDTNYGTQVIVSRSCAGFVKKLFELEVPELRTGLVRVKSIVREAGNRTKMSVYSDDLNLDALAACIGPKGERVNNVVRELNGEKVDIILYTSNLREYIVRCLNPLKNVVALKIDEDAGKAQIIVPDDKLSLAIGKGGMNARLAARLTGLKLDIKPLSVMESQFEEGEDDE